MNKTLPPQSATGISDFKHCPMLYYLRNILRLRPVEDPATLRQGTNWHKCLEILTLMPGEECICDPRYQDSCPICEGRGLVPKDLKSALMRYMNEAYKDKPNSVEWKDWEEERIVLFYSALGWQWYWSGEPIETVATEVPFKHQINSLLSRRGKIDRIIRDTVQLLLGEYKSTSRPIDSGSSYWDRLKLDSQITLYIIEARYAQQAGLLEPHGIKADDPLISGVLYDVWHKPGISPKKLTQADSKKFIADGIYFGEKFEVKMDCSLPQHNIDINGVEVQVELGAETKPTKKNPNPTRAFAIRETPEMYGARLLADIQENPEKHFARREISRTDDELRRADEEFHKIARLTNITLQRDLWFKNENHCGATYRCAFTPICYYNLDVSDGNVPEGFKCLIKK